MAPSRASVAAPSSGVRVPRHAVGERPFIVIWEATRACPLACRHCRAVAVPDRHPDELSTDEAQDLLGQVADFGRPPPLFVITGGDPFQRPDLCRLVRHGTELGVPVAVAPSGTPTLTAAALEAVYEAGAKAVSLSLDGSTAATHDEFRGVEGVYGWTLDAWRTARRLGLRVQVNTTVTGHNLDDLADIGAVVREQGAMLWSLFLLVPTGRGRLLPALTPHDVEDVLNFGYDIGAVLATKTTEAHHFRRVVIQRRILEEHDVDHESLLGLGPQYRRLRARLHTLGLDAGDRRARRPPLDINAGRGTLGKLIRDDQIYYDARAAIARFNTTAERIDNMVAAAQRGEGTVGKLLNDETLYTNVNQLSSEGVKMLYDFRQNPKKYLTIKFELF